MPTSPTELELAMADLTLRGWEPRHWADRGGLYHPEVHQLYFQAPGGFTRHAVRGLAAQVMEREGSRCEWALLPPQLILFAWRVIRAEDTGHQPCQKWGRPWK